MKSDPTKIAKLVGKNMANQRNAAGLTQEELGVKLGVGSEAVSRMERGLTIPSVVRLYELAEVLKCDVTQLLRIPPTKDQLAEIQATLDAILVQIKQTKAP